jgi:amino acid transporter
MSNSLRHDILSSSRLKQNALSLVDTITLAVAGTAPSYSLNATTAVLIGAVGLASPGALLYGAIPMFGIAFAFKYLNQWRADAGASYAWVGRSMNPYLGFISGWTFLVLGTTFMVAAVLPVGGITVSLVAPQLQDNLVATTLVASLWMMAVATLNLLGVRWSARFQRVMTAIEALALLVLAVGAFLKFSTAPQNAFSFNWFSPFAFGDVSTFMAGMLIAVFYYFGWDVASNVAEETQDSHATPGNSGVIGMIGIVVLFMLIQVSVQMGMATALVQQNGANLLVAFGDAILPRPWGQIATLAVLVSTIGTIDTQLTQCARTLFSMGRDGVIHKKFAEIHPQFQTPWLAGVLITMLALLLLVLSSFSESIGSVMKSLISAIGVMVSFYYGMSGLACAYYYRRMLRRNWQTLVMRGLWPVGSAVFLLILGVMQLPTLGWGVSLLTIGAIVIGCLPMVYYRWKYRSEFYAQRSESYHPPSLRRADDRRSV